MLTLRDKLSNVCRAWFLVGGFVIDALCHPAFLARLHGPLTAFLPFPDVYGSVQAPPWSFVATVWVLGLLELLALMAMLALNVAWFFDRVQARLGRIVTR